MASADTGPDIPENLFHTLPTIVDLHRDPSGSTRSYYVLSTRGTFCAAQAYSAVSLRRIGFRDEDFAQLDVRPAAAEAGSEEAAQWPHGEGVLVYARAVSGEEFLLSINTTPNNDALRLNSHHHGGTSTGTGTSGAEQGEDEGTLRLPDGAQFLHYVLQTTIDYNADRSGSAQAADIEGAYVHRADAWTAAHRCLLAGDEDEDSARSRFAEYDSRGDAGFIGEWPFDEDTAVHAVAETGQNFTVAVKTPPHIEAKRKAELRRVVERHKLGGEAGGAGEATKQAVK
ncbi:endonuclease/reverse transcriptase [Purpureocillium lavendulum]|uniref:Endonuclease/reverse transcriptase n=1 Tax=Purpureocillium lavendulum TaxID=1247861 RepID=A0AB34FCZ0_9HYPO|nr:endonuclease/reverse transcriptase [Purpureocillium lavendulum]